MRRPTLLPILLAAAALACGQSSDEAATGGQASVASEQMGSRVPLDPTMEGELPPGIIGQRGELRGTGVPYLAGDPSTVCARSPTTSRPKVT